MPRVPSWIGVLVIALAPSSSAFALMPGTPATPATQALPGAQAPQSCEAICGQVIPRAGQQQAEQFRGSQLETQCLAFQQAKGVGAGEKIILGLNVTAAATCTMACASMWMPGFQAMLGACSIAGTATSTAEMIQTLKSKQYLGAAMGAFGLYTSAKGLPAAIRGPAGARVPQGAQALYGSNNQIVGYQVPAANGQPAQLLNAQGTADASVSGVPRSELADPKSATPTRADQQRSRAKSACISAAMFGAMTGLRAISMKGQGRTRDQACQAVRDLAAAGALGGMPSGTPETSGGTQSSGSDSGGGYGGAGGSESGAGGGGSPSDASGSTAGLSTSAIRDPNSMLASTPYGGCMGETACRNAALSEGSKPPRSEIAAADVNALKQSGLDRLLAPKAAELDMDKIEKQLASGGNLGGAVGAAMGGGGPLGAALGNLVNAAMADGEKLGTAYASGNPATGAGGPAGDGNPMGLLGEQALGAASQTDFQKAPSLLGDGSCPADDIWHTNCAPNTTIFTIVSEKLMRSHDRVERLPWARPINRELSSSP